MIKIENREQIEDIINNNNIVVMDFYADWCGPCKVLLPVLDKLSTEINNVTFCKINVEEHGDLAKEYGIRSIPALKLIKGGEEVATTLGAKTADKVITWIEDNTK